MIHLTGTDSHIPSAREEEQGIVCRNPVKKKCITAPFNKRIYLKYMELEKTWQKIEK